MQNRTSGDSNQPEARASSRDFDGFFDSFEATEIAAKNKPAQGLELTLVCDTMVMTSEWTGSSILIFPEIPVEYS